MKRSDMVKLMTDAFWDAPDRGPDDFNELALDYVLSEMEKAGVKPPFVLKYRHGGNTDIVSECFVWEPEDE